MKPNTLIHLILLVVCVFHSCNNYEFPASQYPRIATLPVVDITEDGVTFQGDLTYIANNVIIDHGFVWGVFSDPSSQNEGRLSLGSLTSLGQFKSELKSGMEKNQVYYVQAYINTDKYLVYGEPVPFTSQGSTLPIINSVVPAQATWGDTLVLRGKYFSSLLAKNVVTFGSLTSKVLTATDSTIRCIVPNNITTKSVPIIISSVGFKSLPFNGFTLQSPSIDNISPSVATFDDIIIITGINFSRDKAKNIFKFNEHLAEVTEASKTTLKVKVPRSIRKKVDVISLTVNLQTTSLEGKFSIAAPTISSVSSDKVFIGDEIEVAGNNFHPDGGNIVLFNGTQVLASSTKTSLSFIVPSGVFINRMVDIEVSVAGLTAKIEKVTEIQDVWIAKNSVPPPFATTPNEYLGFSINNSGYVGFGANGSFRKYNPAEQVWSVSAPFPGKERTKLISFVIGKNGYIGGGLNSETFEQEVDFWKYDSEENAWTRINDVPQSIQELFLDPDNADMKEVMGVTALSAGGMGYIIQRLGNNDLWMYNPSTDAWTKKSTPPETFDVQTGFSISNNLIFSSYGSIKKYNLVANSWTTSAGLSLTEDYTQISGFNIGGYGYILTSNYLHKYDPITDEWIAYENNTVRMDEGAATFVLGEKAYIYNGLFWEYDPVYQLEESNSN